MRPERANLIEAARALMPGIRARAGEAEELRRVPDTSMRELVDAGLLRIYQPRRFGGLEIDYALQVEVALELGRGCGSTAWVQGVLASHAWVLGMMEPAAQADVWQADPDALVANAFFPAQPHCVAVSDGYVLDGVWRFASGIDHCAWANLNVQVPGDGSMEHRFMLVPKRDWTLIDDWYATGLAATGSKALQLTKVFVPRHRTLLTVGCRGGPTPGSSQNDSHLFRLPLMGAFPLGVAAPALGVAHGMLATLSAENLTKKTAVGVPTTDLPAVQMRLAMAAAEIDAAVALLRATGRDIDAYDTQAGNLERRARWRRDMAYAVSLCVQAGERLYPLIGARGLARGNPVQRHWRDLHAIGSHAALSWDGQAQTYGRVLVGLPPADARL